MPFTPSPLLHRARPPTQDVPSGSSLKHAHFEMKEISQVTIEQPKRNVHVSEPEQQKSNISKTEQLKSDSTKTKQLKSSLSKTKHVKSDQHKLEDIESNVNPSRKNDGRNKKRISQDKPQKRSHSDKTKPRRPLPPAPKDETSNC